MVRPLRIPALLSFAIFAAAMVLSHAQESALLKPDDLKKPEVVRGQALFQQNCGACHGNGAAGGMGPNLLTSAIVRHDVGGNEIGTVVHEGRMDKGMPAFPQITAAQTTDIAAFLHARVASTARGSALSGGAANGNNFLTGNAAAGKVFFDSKCTSCHSATGDLNGIATKLAPPDLMTAMLLPKAGPATGSVTPKAHPNETVKGTFVHRDEFTITLRTADGVTHTWATQDVTVHADDPLKGHRDLLPTYTDKDTHDVFAYLETLR